MDHSLRQLSLTELVLLLRTNISAVTHRGMVDLLHRLVLTDDEISSHVCFRETQYVRNIVVSDPQFEILVMCWKSGQRSLIHDHGRSLGAVKVLRGVLTESLFTRGPNGMIKPVASTDYKPYAVQIEEQSTIHQVSNLQPEGHDAISLHLYIPPLFRMNTYTLYATGLRSASGELQNFGSGI